MNNLKRFYPHLLSFLGFVLVALIYFYPVLQGKKILQSDIVQYTAMAKEQNDFRAEYNAEPYWTNSAFGGMPTYQMGANYPHNYIKKLDGLIRFLPRPADYMFLYFIGFYILLLVMKVNPLKAFFGSIAFGFSTYLIIILGVGHNAKAHAIGYMPMVLAGVLLVFQQRNYIVGGLLTTVAVALEINANHFQMTYYLLILLLIAAVYFTYEAIKNKETKSLFYSFGTLAIAAIFAIGSNATGLLATAEYAKESTRGKTDLTYNADGSKNQEKSLMSYEYITQYSYGIAESLNLISPRIFGGSMQEDVGTNSAIYEFAIANNVPEDQSKEIVKTVPTYWGGQYSVAGPAYIGAVVFFLAVLALFCDKRKIKYVFLAGALVSLILSWGKNFPLVTNFFIDYVPMYNKFRAVSSIQVIVELCIPILSIMGLQSFYELKQEEKWPNLWKAAALSLGVLLFLLVFKSIFSFAGEDAMLVESYGPEFVDALKIDRKSMYTSDLLRSIFFISVVFGLLWLYIKNTISSKVSVVLVGLFMIADLFLISNSYVNSDSFVKAKEVNEPFVEEIYDTAILKDKSHYRVFEVNQNAMSDPRACYFHNSIGGYSAVKPKRMQELFEYQIANNNLEILNMLNVKYIIQENGKGQKFPIENTKTNGNAWFIEQLKTVPNADAEMKALDKFDSKKIAFTEVEAGSKVDLPKTFVKDTSASIKLINFKSNELKYVSNNNNKGFAVFSEMYYKNGWNAYINGKLTNHIRANYALRGLLIPAGKHTIEFKFEPQVVQTGSMISLFSCIGIIVLFGFGIYFENKKNISKL